MVLCASFGQTKARALVFCTSDCLLLSSAALPTWNANMSLGVESVFFLQSQSQLDLPVLSAYYCWSDEEIRALFWHVSAFVPKSALCAELF